MPRWVAVLLLVGCSSSVPVFPTDDIAEPIDSGRDATIPKDASFDVVDEDATKFNGGGPFNCNGCVCDGTLDYCATITGPHAPMLDDAGSDDAEAGACDPDASTCTQIPVECLPKPTCACVMQHYSPPCTCEVDPSGNGLMVTCDYP